MQSVDTVSRQNSIISAAAVNDEGVMAIGRQVAVTGACGFGIGRVVAICSKRKQLFSQVCWIAKLDSVAFDSTGSRLITCEADKTIKMWKRAYNLDISWLFKHVRVRFSGFGCKYGWFWIIILVVLLRFEEVLISMFRYRFLVFNYNMWLLSRMCNILILMLSLYRVI
ncbi:hypothetical protein ACP275_05G127600 [Erythranthe tilingii]